MSRIDRLAGLSRDSERCGFDAQAVYLAGEDLVGGCALVEAPGGGLYFQSLELRCHGVGSYVGAGALAVVSKPQGALRVVVADCLIEQDHLTGGVVHQGCEDLAHQFFIIQGDLAELLEI